MKTLAIEAVAPLLFRDGRPFGSQSDETRARGTILPLPSTVSGLIRTAVGDAAGWDWSLARSKEDALRISVGLQALRLENLADGTADFQFPAPKDAVVFRARDASGVTQGDPQITRLAPAALAEGEGSDLPAGLQLLLDGSAGKPEPGYELWSWADLRQWLLGSVKVPTKQPVPPVEERVQVEISAETGSVTPGKLFTVEYRAWESAVADSHLRWQFVVQADASPAGIAHFGGERRPVVITSEAAVPECDAELIAALTGSLSLKCTLTSPAAFTGGWRPGWLFADDSPLTSAGAVLVAAAVGEPQALSGWDYAARGPKASRRLAPAGSTYFFRLARPLTADEALALWLAPISDKEQDRRDGFGCAVWGVWK